VIAQFAEPQKHFPGRWFLWHFEKGVMQSVDHRLVREPKKRIDLAFQGQRRDQRLGGVVRLHQIVQQRQHPFVVGLAGLF
jgi:hypothetical protein